MTEDLLFRVVMQVMVDTLLVQEVVVDLLMDYVQVMADQEW